MGGDELYTVDHLKPVTFICYRNSATQINQLLLIIVGIDCKKRRQPNSANTHARQCAPQ